MAGHITGKVFNIQRYAVHDGPGIRTIVFLKGCPMRCDWCENPESIEPRRQLAFYSPKCIGCGDCQPACPRGAIDLTRAERIDRVRCDNCGQCARVCPVAALKLIGEDLTVEDVLAQVLRDRKFYERSGGGVTISGGEPTLQYDFLYALLQACKDEGLHTVLETNGLVAWEKLEQLTPLVDIFYLDLKSIDPALHKQHTGVSNDLILSNARKLMAKKQAVVFRLPLIPGINTTTAQLELMADFLNEIKAKEVHLLPYHKLGENKLASIHSGLHPLPVPEMSRGEAEELQKLFHAPGRRVIVGGA
ncbi:hypothetical protein SY88_14220 [Clostridiales bacterium PH28_bin88]|nr:hypothetical protein SY88_14220 [Clostridiales bacterium PH28_bin88]